MSEEKPIKRSRWVKKSDVPRYDKATQDYIYRQYREADGWWRGARVKRDA